MKTFTVTVSYTEYGYTFIDANTASEAEEMARKKLSDKGLDGLEDYEYQGRDYDVTDAEEVDAV